MITSEESAQREESATAGSLPVCHLGIEFPLLTFRRPQAFPHEKRAKSQTTEVPALLSTTAEAEGNTLRVDEDDEDKDGRATVILSLQYAALHLAAQRGRCDIICLLVEGLGFNPCITIPNFFRDEYSSVLSSLLATPAEEGTSSPSSVHVENEAMLEEHKEESDKHDSAIENPRDEDEHAHALDYRRRRHLVQIVPFAMSYTFQCTTKPETKTSSLSEEQYFECHCVHYAPREVDQDTEEVVEEECPNLVAQRIVRQLRTFPKSLYLSYVPCLLPSYYEELRVSPNNPNKPSSSRSILADADGTESNGEEDKEKEEEDEERSRARIRSLMALVGPDDENCPVAEFRVCLLRRAVMHGHLRLVRLLVRKDWFARRSGNLFLPRETSSASFSLPPPTRRELTRLKRYQHADDYYQPIRCDGGEGSEGTTFDYSVEDVRNYRYSMAKTTMTRSSHSSRLSGLSMRTSSVSVPPLPQPLSFHRRDHSTRQHVSLPLTTSYRFMDERFVCCVCPFDILMTALEVSKEECECEGRGETDDDEEDLAPRKTIVCSLNQRILKFLLTDTAAGGGGFSANTLSHEAMGVTGREDASCFYPFLRTGVLTRNAEGLRIVLESKGSGAAGEIPVLSSSSFPSSLSSSRHSSFAFPHLANPRALPLFHFLAFSDDPDRSIGPLLTMLSEVLTIKLPFMEFPASSCACTCSSGATLSSSLPNVVRVSLPKVLACASDRWGLTPLMLAVYSRDIKAMRALLSLGADVDAVCEDRSTLCEWAEGPATLASLAFNSASLPRSTPSRHSRTSVSPPPPPLHVQTLSLLLSHGMSVRSTPILDQFYGSWRTDTIEFGLAGDDGSGSGRGGGGAVGVKVYRRHVRLPRLSEEEEMEGFYKCWPEPSVQAALSGGKFHNASLPDGGSSLEKNGSSSFEIKGDDKQKEEVLSPRWVRRCGLCGYSIVHDEDGDGQTQNTRDTHTTNNNSKHGRKRQRSKTVLEELLSSGPRDTEEMTRLLFEYGYDPLEDVNNDGSTALLAHAEASEIHYSLITNVLCPELSADGRGDPLFRVANDGRTFLSVGVCYGREKIEEIVFLVYRDHFTESRKRWAEEEKARLEHKAKVQNPSVPPMVATAAPEGTGTTSDDRYRDFCREVEARVQSLYNPYSLLNMRHWPSPFSSTSSSTMSKDGALSPPPLSSSPQSVPVSLPLREVVRNCRGAERIEMLVGMGANPLLALRSVNWRGLLPRAGAHTNTGDGGGDSEGADTKKAPTARRIRLQCHTQHHLRPPAATAAGGEKESVNSLFDEEVSSEECEDGELAHAQPATATNSHQNGKPAQIPAASLVTLWCEGDAAYEALKQRSAGGSISEARKKETLVAFLRGALKRIEVPPLPY